MIELISNAIGDAVAWLVEKALRNALRWVGRLIAAVASAFVLRAA